MIRLLYALCLQLFLVVNSEIVSSDISNSYSNSNTDYSAVRPKVWESPDVSSHLESVLSLVTGNCLLRYLLRYLLRLP